MSATNIYRQRGVRTLINAKGPATRLSGGIMRPEVIAAMTEAAGHCVDMAELEAHASQMIADLTGAEAGYVASGAAIGGNGGCREQPWVLFAHEAAGSLAASRQRRRRIADYLMSGFLSAPSTAINRTLTGADPLAEGKTANPAALVMGYRK